ncbi:transcriptional regulator [Streptomyces sp. NPDC004610]|uniref:transcriptional regulator n=1 Tax=unclassified Streptomyces TaxID=2593676 RepID=UPI0033BA4AB9
MIMVDTPLPPPPPASPPPPPPPPLPVRHHPRHRRPASDQDSGALSPMLIRLAAEGATGTLHRERGSLRLAAGQVVHAESPSAPGVEALLPADAPLPQGALELRRLEALYDAAYFALAPSSTPGRFRYGGEAGGEGVGPVRVPVAVLERTVVRRRALLDRIWPDPRADTAPLVRAGDVPARSVTVRQRAVLDRVDGVRTAPDIARELGRQGFHTLVDVRRLVAAGLIRPAEPEPEPYPDPEPYREPAPIPAPTPTPDPDITLLKRLRDALEAL